MIMLIYTEFLIFFQFGTFNLHGEEYIIQNIRNQTFSRLNSGLNKFEIRREKVPEVNFQDVFGNSRLE